MHGYIMLQAVSIAYTRLLPSFEGETANFESINFILLLNYFISVLIKTNKFRYEWYVSGHYFNYEQNYTG